MMITAKTLSALQLLSRMLTEMAAQGLAGGIVDRASLFTFSTTLDSIVKNIDESSVAVWSPSGDFYIHPHGDTVQLPGSSGEHDLYLKLTPSDIHTLSEMLNEIKALLKQYP